MENKSWNHTESKLMMKYSIYIYREREREIRYGLEGPGIESRLWERFSAAVHTGPGTHLASYRMGTGPFPGVKRPGHGVNHPPPSSADVEEKVELYICSLSGPSWPVLGKTLPLPYILIYRMFQKDLYNFES